MASSSRTRVLIGCLAFALVGSVTGAVAVVRTLSVAEQEDFDPVRGRAALVRADDTEADRAPDTDVVPAPESSDVDPQAAVGHSGTGYETLLILGSDARDDLGGARADVILLAMLPDDGSSPVLISLPRDLWVDNACTGARSRINAGLNGCGDGVSGPELMAIMVEDFTSLPVQHYVEVDFEGFAHVVDALGGLEVCNAYPIREGAWSMPAGCSEVGGEDALEWVRSRRTQELVDGRWRTQPGVSDLRRNERQREVLLQGLERVSELSSPADVTRLVGAVAGAVTVSDSLSLARTARVAWSLRGTGRDEIVRIELPVSPRTTAGGAHVLEPRETFASTLGRELSAGTAAG